MMLKLNARTHLNAIERNRESEESEENGANGESEENVATSVR